MAARNTSESERFFYHQPDREVERYYMPITRSSSNVNPTNTGSSFRPTTATIQSTDENTSRPEVGTPARRVVLIRNNKHRQVNEGPVDLGDLTRSNSLNDPPRYTDGHKTLFLIRRPISHKSVEYLSPVHEPSSTTGLEYINTPTPPPEIVLSPDPPQSPRQSAKTYKRTAYSGDYVPYLRQPRSKSRTASLIRLNSTRRSPSPKQEESHETNHTRTFYSLNWKNHIDEPVHSPPVTTHVTEQQTVQRHISSRGKSARRKKTGSAHTKSLLIGSTDESPVTVIENSYIEEERSKSAGKHSKSVRRTRFENEESMEEIEKKSRRQRCFDCLSRYMCLVILICLILILIGLAGVGVSAYFLAINSTNNFTPTVVGIVVGGSLAIATLCFLYILVACIGARDGYFTYNDDGPRAGGRALAMIPPSHPHAHHYIPHDFTKMTDNGYRSAPHDVSFNQSQQHTIHRSKTSSAHYKTKSNKNNILIEMPERLITGGRSSPRTRERSLNKVVRNIGHVVEDTKKRYHGDPPTKVIVKVDKNATSTV